MSSSSNPAPFIGIGTGRCGTNSLTRILDACKNCRVTHETYQVQWYKPEEELGRLIRDFRDSRSAGVLRGEVSQALGPHVANIRSSIRDLKVVCLRRGKSETVESFVDFRSWTLRPGDKRKWIDEAYGDTIRARAAKCFPLIDAWDRKQAFEFYWELYQRIMDAVPEPVIHVDVNELNDDAKLLKIMDFLEIPEPSRILITKRQWYTRDEVREQQKRMGANVLIK